MTNTCVGFIVGIGLLLGTATAANADIKIGYVDLQKAASATEDGRRAQEQIKAAVAAKQKDLDKQSAELNKAAEDLKKRWSLLSEEVRQKKDAELSAKMQRTRAAYLDHQKALADQDQKASQRILGRMQEIVAHIAADENFTLIIDKNQAGIVFGRPEFDLTAMVIRRYNDKFHSPKKQQQP